MTDPKRLSDERVRELLVFCEEILARGRELEDLREKCADLEAAWRAANAEANDHCVRIDTLEAENAALRRLRSVVLTLIERVEEEQSQPHTSPMVFVDALEPLRAALNNARASGEGEDKP